MIAGPLLALILALPAAAQDSSRFSTPASPPPAASSVPSILPQLPSQSPERQALEKLATENQTEKERLSQKLRQLTEQREETALKYLLRQELLKLDLADIESQQRRLSLENATREEKLRQELAELEAKQRRFNLENAMDPKRRELERAGLENQLERERVIQKLRALNGEREEAALKNALQQEKLRLELAELEAEQRRLMLQNSVVDEKGRQELAELKQKRDRLKLEGEIERENILLSMARNDHEKSAIELETRRIDLQSRKLRFQTEEAEAKTVSLRTDLDMRSKKEEWKSEANRDPDYFKEPFKEGVLTVSDRRIPLNGPIVRGVADFVTERIHYFNNKSEEQPLFIIIDRSPGGSVMEGYRIVKAMKASKAPVYVVVRSFAASMAAVITALAPKSYAYPNAVILHHQMSSFMWGNMTQMKEQLEIANEWYRRLGTPVAEKMGTDLTAFTKQMYAHSSDGDWEEFADKAKKLRWVDDIVHEIRETGIYKDPDKAPKPKPVFEWHEEKDAKGEPFVRLPRLEPFDLYYLYNRDGYYR